MVVARETMSDPADYSVVLSYQCREMVSDPSDHSVVLLY